jgi:superoxide reductase
MKFTETIKSPETEGKEKHVPVIEIDRAHGKSKTDIVRIIVGKDVPHPNTVEHHIVWAELFGVKQNGQVISLGRTDFTPTFTSPIINIRLNIPLEEFKAFGALSYCNVHGLWENLLEV